LWLAFFLDTPLDGNSVSYGVSPGYKHFKRVG
jgi:hypothetical protein